jgi:hypothetical protein
MRTEAIVVFVLVAATPAFASKSCMTMGEARQQFATTHLYWHGPGHCWDATAPRHRVVHRARPTADQAREDRPREDQPRQEHAARQDDRVASSSEPNWRNAMSEMLPGDAPVEGAGAAVSGAAREPSRTDWLDRWVDIAQVTSSVLDREDEPADMTPTVESKAVAAVTPVHLIVMFIIIVVTLASIEMLFRSFIVNWRR